MEKSICDTVMSLEQSYKLVEGIDIPNGSYLKVQALYSINQMIRASSPAGYIAPGERSGLHSAGDIDIITMNLRLLLKHS